MSIEYTIDIQLTELGYEDILQPLDSARETPCRSTSPDSLSDSLPQRFLVSGQRSNDGKEAAKHTSSASASALSKTPAQGQHDEEAVRGSAKQDDSNKYVDCADTAQEDSTEMQVVLDDSDDSEVSEVYDEEEVDEEDEEQEEGLSYETSLSGDYRCSVCDLELPSKFKLQDHMNLHTGARPYCCAECGKRFCQIYNYRVHLRKHAQTKVHRLQCRICLRDFASQEDLKAHQSRTHFESEFYECDLCKRIFTSLKACENHVQSHTCRPSVVCDLCGRKFSSQRSLARHRKMRCHRSFKCTDCTKTFTKKNALLKHSFSHLGLLPYTCIRCRCHFRLARLYRKHKCEPERVHCVACLREFLSQQDFQQHKKDTGCWGNQEPKGDEIRCLECGQRFDTSEELKKHAGAHQRVLKCAECGKGFRSALLLMSHMGGHAGNSPCLCQSCGLGFPHQQNYDSHLKTCGQTPQPASAPRKRQASKSSSSQTKQDNEKPESSNPTNTAATPAATPAAVSNNPAVISDSPASPSNSSVAPVKDSCSPGPVTEEPPAGSGPSDGLWKLTLNKQPPPGVKLVVFLPVCAADGLTLPSEMSPTLPVPVVHGSPLDALPPVSGEHVGVKVALGASLNGPMNLVTGVKQDPGWEAPLDLSKKFNSSKCALSTVPLLPVKSEPGEAEISGEANSTERQEFQNGKEIVKRKPGETDDQGKRVFTPSSGLMIDIKKEAQAPDPAFDLWASSHGSGQLTDAEIKKEVDISRSAVVNISSEGKIK